MSDFVMPSLGADMSRATLVAWNVAPGDRVVRGDILCEVDTDKGVIEVEVWEDGIVRELVAEVGEDVSVGGVLARLDAPGVAPPPGEEAPPAHAPALDGHPPGEAAPPADAPPEVRRLSESPTATDAPPTAPAASSRHAPPAASAASAVPTPPTDRPDGRPATPPADPRLRVTPAARVAARELDVELAAVQGTGPGGAITSADVEAAHAASPPSPHLPDADGPRATPVARRMAEVHGLDLAGVEGSGPRHAVTRADLEPLLQEVPMPAEPARRGTGARGDEAGDAPGRQHAPGRQDAPEREDVPGGKDDLAAEEGRKARLREAIAAAMARSKREIPHYYLSETVDMGAAVAWVEAYNENRPPGERILLTALLVHAVAGAAREVPEMNGFFEDERFHPASDVHAGIAISLRGGGVVTPALHHCHDRDVPGIMEGLRDLVARARRGKLRASEMTGGTLTITALGEMGVESVFGVIFPPQVAIVGFGRVSERPWAHRGLLGVRPAMTVTLAADHRVSDGITGARFLLAIRQRLEHPESP